MSYFAVTERRGALYLSSSSGALLLSNVCKLGGSRNKWQTCFLTFLFSLCPEEHSPVLAQWKSTMFLASLDWISSVKTLGLSHWGQTKNACCHRLPNLSTMSFMR